MKLILFLFFAIAVSFCSCMGTPDQHYPACYGVEFNPTREALGIPLLKGDWVATDSTSEKTIWKPLISQEKSYYSAKRVYYHNGTLSCEINEYTSNKKYTTEDGTSVEFLAVWFYYISSKYNKNRPKDDPKEGEVGFIYIYSHCDESGFFTTRDRITKLQADSLLISWGLGDEIIPIQTKK